MSAEPVRLSAREASSFHSLYLFSSQIGGPRSPGSARGEKAVAEPVGRQIYLPLPGVSAELGSRPEQLGAESLRLDLTRGAQESGSEQAEQLVRQPSAKEPVAGEVAHASLAHQQVLHSLDPLLPGVVSLPGDQSWSPRLVDENVGEIGYLSEVEIEGVCPLQRTTPLQ